MRASLNYGHSQEDKSSTGKEIKSIACEISKKTEELNQRKRKFEDVSAKFTIGEELKVKTSNMKQFGHLFLVNNTEIVEVNKVVNANWNPILQWMP